MKKDNDCLAELRKTRQRISAKYLYDPAAWFKHLGELTETFAERYYPGEDPKLITIKRYEE
jgi:beta-mannanase